jgi:hypothetical protein
MPASYGKLGASVTGVNWHLGRAGVFACPVVCTTVPSPQRCSRRRFGGAGASACPSGGPRARSSAPPCPRSRGCSRRRFGGAGASACPSGGPPGGRLHHRALASRMLPAAFRLGSAFACPGRRSAGPAGCTTVPSLRGCSRRRLAAAMPLSAAQPVSPARPVSPPWRSPVASHQISRRRYPSETLGLVFAAALGLRLT